MRSENQNKESPSSVRSISLTGDFFDATGSLKYPDIGLDSLDSQPLLKTVRFPEHHSEIQADQLRNADAVLVLTPRVTAKSLEQSDRLLVVARFGVGYDGVDVPACTQRDVLLTIAKGAVDRPVAEATLAWMLALSYRVAVKDRLVREVRWDDRNFHMGQDLRETRLGIVGFGGIGRELMRLTNNFGMKPPLVFDPFLSDEAVRQSGAIPTKLDMLLTESDFVSLHCPLTPGTRGLIGGSEIAKMKPTAFLINTARGGIVDEVALENALRNKSIAGAAIDCFETEPLTARHRLAELDNVLLAPHSIAWTNGMFRDIGRTALTTIVELFHGRRPQGVINPEVFDRPGFQKKWEAFSDRSVEWIA